MKKATENLRIIGRTNSIAELNLAYNETMLLIGELSFEGVSDRSEVELLLNHITNYNIVRVANNASDKFEASSRMDNSLLVEISECRASIKEHPSNSTERELLDGLCSLYNIQ